MRDFLEWFEIKNNKHLTAFKKFLDSGAWPKGFIPKDVTLSYHCFTDLSFKLSDQYLKDKLEEIVGHKIEEAFRCKGCEHVYQEAPSSCDCNVDKEYEPCFIVEQSTLDRIKFLEKRIKELEEELQSIAEDAAGSSL
jgi:hypothetical protein